MVSAFPDTSRKPKKGERESRTFAFTSRSKMETDIKNGRYLEHGEYESNLYGIKTESIQEVIEAGRICILDPNPQVGMTKTAIRQLTTAHANTCTHTHTHFVHGQHVRPLWFHSSCAVDVTGTC